MTSEQFIELQTNICNGLRKSKAPVNALAAHDAEMEFFFFFFGE